MTANAAIRPYILATAGHVDHGKSALVLALTGIDPDRLPEEKARGITIDLGFAALHLPSPPDVTPAVQYQVGVVDVPGHEDFVKNMVAGVGSIDAALLVVAADDGWMPQTEEHLQILTYLGVSHGVIALSKVDLAVNEQQAIDAVRERLSGTPLADAPIVPTSVPSGRGIGELKTALSEVLARTPPQRDVGKPRLSIDRVFSLKGVGTVVTGTLAGGPLRRGQQLVIQPTNTQTRIRGTQSHNREIEVAFPGSRVALHLTDLHPSDGRATRSPGTVARGDVVSIAELGSPTSTIDCLLERSPRSIGDAAAPPRPLKSGALVQLHHGTAAVPARVRLLDAAQLSPGARALARLSLQSPLLALSGDRFVIRDWPEQHTLAGGIVLDSDQAGSSKRATANRSLLEQRAINPFDATVFVATSLQRDGVAPAAALGLHSRFSHSEIESAVECLIRAGSVKTISTMLADAGVWSRLRGQCEQFIDAHHRAHSEQSGAPLADLPPIVSKALPAHAGALVPGVCEALVDDLCVSGFTRTNAAIRRSSHRPSLPPRLEAAAREIHRRLAASPPFGPPSRKEIATGDLAQQALRFMIASGEVVELGPDVVMPADAYAKAVRAIIEYLRVRGSATVSDLKTLLASNRRVMVPLLERLDHERITRREGDLRFIRQ